MTITQGSLLCETNPALDWANDWTKVPYKRKEMGDLLRLLPYISIPSCSVCNSSKGGRCELMHDHRMDKFMGHIKKKRLDLWFKQIERETET